MIRQDWSTLKKLMFMKTAAGGGAAVEATATGNPLTFLTDLAKPLKSLLIPFTPIQSGTGDPSPHNIRSILPWNGLSVWCGGFNLIDLSKLTDGLWWNGIINTASSYIANYRATEKIPVKPGATYYVSRNSGAQNYCSFFGKDGAYLRQTGISSNGQSVTMGDDVYFIGITIGKDYTDTALLKFGGTYDQSDYETGKPITSHPVSFPSPIYGGTLDVVSGVLTVEWAKVKISDLDWNYQANWNGRFRAGLAGKDGVNADVSANLMCDCYKSELGTNSNNNIICGYGKGNSGLVYIKDNRFTDKDDFVEAVGDYYIYYPLLEPQEITLTPQQITALIGNNTIWSDADGSMTATYLKKG